MDKKIEIIKYGEIIKKGECPICLDEIDIENISTQIVPCCKNLFHTDCIIKCLTNKPNCPLCRKDLQIFINTIKNEYVILESSQIDFTNLVRLDIENDFENNNRNKMKRLFSNIGTSFFLCCVIYSFVKLTT